MRLPTKYTTLPKYFPIDLEDRAGFFSPLSIIIYPTHNANATNNHNDQYHIDY